MRIRFTVLLLLLLGSAGVAGVNDVVVLRSIRYSVQEGRGRVAVGTDGVPVVAARHRGDVVTLGFPRATVSSPPGAARVTFNEGPVSSAAIERSGPDSITVIIRLRKGGNVDVGLEGHDVVLRVTPEALMGAAAQGAGGTSVTASESPVTLGLSTLLNAGEGRFQRVDDAAGETAASRVSPGLVLVILGILTFSAALSLIVAMVVVRMLQRKTSVPAAAGPPAEEEPRAVPPEEPVWDESAEENDAPVYAAEEPEETEEETEERAYQLAKAFRRGKGEVDLARRMEAKQDVLFGTKINESCHASKTKAQRVQNAKRLGVGRGEIDLALRLKDLVPAMHSDEEET
ncbi:MAG: hypothetical protein WB699_19630 [Bacteroidota bacterium]